MRTVKVPEFDGGISAGNAAGQTHEVTDARTSYQR